MSYFRFFADLRPETEFKGSISDFLKFTGEFKKLEKIIVVNVKQSSGPELKNKIQKLINKLSESELEKLQSFKLENFLHSQGEEAFNDLFKALPENLNSLKLPGFLLGSADKLDEIAVLFSTFPKNLQSLDLSNNSIYTYILKAFNKNLNAKPFAGLPENLKSLNLSNGDLNIPQIKVVVEEKDFIASQNPSPSFRREDFFIRQTLAQLTTRGISIISEQGSDVIRLSDNPSNCDYDGGFKFN